jgi:hypothetical protein
LAVFTFRKRLALVKAAREASCAVIESSRKG